MADIFWDQAFTLPGRVATSAWGLGPKRLLVDGTQTTSILGTVYTDRVTQYTISAGQSGTPNAPYCLLGYIYTNGLGLEVGDAASGYANKVRLVRMGASPYWSTRTALTGWSTTALATDDATRKTVALWLDPLTLAPHDGTHTWAVLFIDGIVQWSADIGAIVNGMTLGYWPINGGNSAIYVTACDCVGLRATPGASFAPHLYDWPVPVVNKQLAISNVTAQWLNELGGAGSYTQWDDANDPDVPDNYNTINVNGQTQTSKGQTAADIGITGHTILENAAGVGPHFIIVHRDEGGGTKWTDVVAINSLGTVTPVTVARPGTSYVAALYTFIKSGSWALADVPNVAFGLYSGSSLDCTWRVTLAQMHWCSYISVYAHGDFPTPEVYVPPAGTPFGQIPTDTLVPDSWAGGSRRFGAVPSDEVVTVGSGSRRWGAVPSDELVPADSDWTT